MVGFELEGLFDDSFIKINLVIVWNLNSKRNNWRLKILFR